MGQCALRIPGVTERTGVRDCGRVPRHQSRKASYISKPRSRFSEHCCHKSQSAEQLDNLPLSREPANKWQNLKEMTLLPQKEWCRYTPQKSAGFGDLKQSHMPETEMLSHRLGKHGLQTETRDTGMVDCFSPRAH